jgi:hypothetical protein
MGAGRTCSAAGSSSGWPGRRGLAGHGPGGRAGCCGPRPGGWRRRLLLRGVVPAASPARQPSAQAQVPTARGCRQKLRAAFTAEQPAAQRTSGAGLLLAAAAVLGRLCAAAGGGAAAAGAAALPPMALRASPIISSSFFFLTSSILAVYLSRTAGLPACSGCARSGESAWRGCRHGALGGAGSLRLLHLAGGAWAAGAAAPGGPRCPGRPPMPERPLASTRRRCCPCRLPIRPSLLRSMLQQLQQQWQRARQHECNGTRVAHLDGEADQQGLARLADGGRAVLRALYHGGQQLRRQLGDVGLGLPRADGLLQPRQRLLLDLGVLVGQRGYSSVERRGQRKVGGGGACRL